MAHIVIISGGDESASSTTERLTDRVYGTFHNWTLANRFLQASGGNGFIYPLHSPHTFQKQEEDQ